MTIDTNFSKWFLQPSKESAQMYETVMQRALTLVVEHMKEAANPFSGADRHSIQQAVKDAAFISYSGEPIDGVIRAIQEGVMKHSLWISHPSAMAHLHCPPLLPSLVAEVVINALNQSMDSWDQSPSATYVETELLRFFTRSIGYSDLGDGVFTSGGTQSNYMGMLLARNKICESAFATNVQEEGLPVDARKLRILCSQEAHFSVQKSAAQLGLGANAVVQVATNERQQLCVNETRQTINELRLKGLIPFMIVATAGTTDFGSIDKLREISELAREQELWLHVDAAYGGALLFSRQYGHLLNGLHLADSITIDFHKFYYQSISCGAFFVKDRHDFERIRFHADYLNPEEDKEADIINLVEKSVQTTKRFDALKLLVTFKWMGTEQFGQMIDYTIQLAKETGELLRRYGFDVLNDPELNAVVFRYVPECHCDDQSYVDQLNLTLQRHFYERGDLIMAKTKQRGHVYLKFTMLNPLNTIENMKTQIQKVKKAGIEFEKTQGAIRHEHVIHS
ncbi:pyridoxal phosphate-dependent decarboxylase family protein [Halalkalibacterium halodurans]|jgi:L-2,4-diaminobutyrate decarboxylase|uniref:2,4-diaminobutyrate decarboxylase n=1 Tax=Halalkalibacterium halodurans TaxID=86665 RepID=A0A0M0KIF1_ALKHA|nr:aspartate aminotransferase family protein [Halalkalibacterium halodurans]MED4163463.1 aspartate aminotransferase family protein [Halalkalibacterium halodurans]TPE69133.1 aspartate aminotransferase family protein [Halalkalibacterium halodurans]